jgi:predicted TIM-barrel fold metal-dependent hydrolase
VRKDPQARLVVLNADHKQYLDQSGDLAAAGNVCFDLSMVEGVGGAARLARQVSIQRVLLGSHSPLFYFESAALKVQEAGFTEAQARAVLEENARRLLAG